MTDDNACLFIGVRVSLETVRNLTELVKDLGRRAKDLNVPIRWVAPATYHITIKYIGWTRRSAVSAIRDQIAQSISGVRPARIVTKGLGGFPRLDKASVLWAGVDDTHGVLEELATKAEGTLVSLGFAPERRAFHPHVTLGRISTVSDLGPLAETHSDRVFSETSVDSLALFESRIKSDNSEYAERALWPLESNSKGSNRQRGPLRRQAEGARETETS